MKTGVYIQSRRGPGVLAARFDAAQEEMLKEAGRHWHEEFLDRHFQMGHFKTYRYGLRVLGYRNQAPQEPGKASYFRNGGLVVKEEPVYQSDDKTQRVRHRLLGIPRTPLVRTGAMRTAAKAGYLLKTKSKSKVGLVMKLPKHAYQYRKDTGRPPIDKIGELTRITDAEARAMADAGKKAFVRKLNGTDAA